MIFQLKKWGLSVSLALLVITGYATFARSTAKNQKAPTAKQKRLSQKPTLVTTKNRAELKSNFLNWQNDPKIHVVERAARRILGWQIYGAVNCGDTWTWQTEQNEISIDDQKIIKPVVSLHKKRRPFLYFVETLNYAEGIVPDPVSTESYRVVVGTRRGQVYEFWQYGASYSGHPAIHHRKWKKPTVQKKGHDILFFDAGQKLK